MKTKLVIILGLATLLGCAKFANNAFRTEQTVTALTYGAYVVYTNGLASGTIKPSIDESNAIKAARLEVAAGIGLLDGWLAAFQTNSAVKPQVQAALDSLTVKGSNMVYLINLSKNK